MANNIGTLITSPIRPQSNLDNFPTAYASEIAGGHHQVQTIEDMIAIPTERRKDGMLCTVINDFTTYQLRGGTWRVDSRSGIFVAPYNSVQKGMYNLTGQNDASDINDIIASLSPTGGRVILLDGTIRLKSPIRPRAQVSILGAGENSTIFRVEDNTNINAFETDERIWYSFFGDFAIDMNKENNNHSALGAAMLMSATHSTVFSRLRIRNVKGRGIIINDDNRIDTMGGLLNKILWCNLEDPEGEGIIWGSGNADFWCCYNNIGSKKANVVAKGSVGKFIGNHLDGSPEYNIYAPYGSWTNVIQGNICEGAHKHSFAFYNGVNNTIVQGNAFSNCGKDGLGYDFIHAEGNLEYGGLIVNGNQMYLTEPGYNARYCVYLKDVSDIAIGVNRFKSGYYADNPVGLAGTVQDIEVIGNCGRNGTEVYIPTNLMAKSEQLEQDSVWFASEVVVTPDQDISPSGAMTADLIASANGGHALRQNITVTPDTDYCFSFYAKNNGSTAAKYSVYYWSETDEGNLIEPTSYIEQIDDTDYTRISVPFHVHAGISKVFVYPLRDSGSPTSLYVWGCMLNIGLTALPYEPAT